MRKAIRDHLRDFLAILGLLTVGLLATYIIVQNQRLRIPLLEAKPFELKADMSTAQAVTPGQGQTVRVAGVRVGDISAVNYEDGHAVVTMDIDRQFLPVYKNATILLRPKTGLKDMFLELDPGNNYDPNSNNDEFQNGDTIPLANTAPDTNVDQILSALDGDTRAYLRLLLTQGGEGLNGRGKDLGKLLGSLGPINRGLARLNTEVAKRKTNLATLIHNMNILWGRVGQDGQGIEQLVTASNQALGAIASQSPDVQRSVGLLGPTLRTTRVALAKTDQLATAVLHVGFPTHTGGEELAYFKDAQEVYDTIGKLFADIAKDPELGPKFRKANTILQYDYREPDSTITLRLQEGEPADVDFGDTEMEPEVVMSMEADTAHRFWLGKVNVTTALARGQIKASGPVAKILKLVPLTKPVYPVYKAQLEAEGREDLVDVD